MTPYLTARSMGLIPASMTEAEYNARNRTPDASGTWNTPEPIVTASEPSVHVGTSYTDQNTDYQAPVNNLSSLGNALTSQSEIDRIRAEARARQDAAGINDYGPSVTSDPRQARFDAYGKSVQNDFGSRAFQNAVNQSTWMGGKVDPNFLIEHRGDYVADMRKKYGMDGANPDASGYYGEYGMQLLDKMGRGEMEGYTPIDRTPTNPIDDGGAPKTTGGTSALDTLRNAYGANPIGQSSGRVGPTTGPGKQYGTSGPFMPPGASDSSLPPGNVGLPTNPGDPYVPTQQYQPLNDALNAQRYTGPRMGGGGFNKGMDPYPGFNPSFGGGGMDPYPGPVEQTQGGWSSKMTQPWQAWGSK